VDASRLRFDFNHHKALSKEELRHVERLVNEKVRENKTVKTYELSYEEAQKHKEIKQFFGEKYGAKVRVIDIEYSKELCGGTHTAHVGTIGFFRISKEGSISAGVRRIEAMTGAMAETFVYETEDLVEHSAGLLKTTPAKLMERISALSEENKALSHELKSFKREGLKRLAQELSHKTQKAGNITLLAAIVDIESDLVRDLVEALSPLMHSGVILLGIKGEDRCQLIAKVSSDLVHKGIHAVQLIKEIAPSIEGSGGGKEAHAQAGGKNPQGLADALEQAKRWLATKILN
jgi:alanyl-tRNA synthetase